MGPAAALQQEVCPSPSRSRLARRRKVYRLASSKLSPLGDLRVGARPASSLVKFRSLVVSRTEVPDGIRALRLVNRMGLRLRRATRWRGACVLRLGGVELASCDLGARSLRPKT